MTEPFVHTFHIANRWPGEKKLHRYSKPKHKITEAKSFVLDGGEASLTNGDAIKLTKDFPQVSFMKRKKGKKEQMFNSKSFVAVMACHAHHKCSNKSH